jgi:TRAP-type C4-dicarboxylate transport system substrate-binding protein
VLRKIRAGQLQGGALTGGALSLIFPDSQVYSLPMMFHSYAELDYVRARMDKKIIQGIEDHGFVTFELTDGGFAYIMSNLRVNHVADLKILKNWVPEGDEITRAMFSSLDAPTLSLPLTDVLTGLQTGLITSIGCTPTGAIALQWHTKTKYLTDLPIMSLYGAMVVDKKPFSNLSQPDQIVVREVISKVISVMSRQTRIDDNGARDALRKQGIVFTALPDEEITKLDSAADKTIQYAIKQGVVSEAIFNELKTNLIAYRRSHPESH